MPVPAGTPAHSPSSPRSIPLLPLPSAAPCWGQPRAGWAGQGGTGRGGAGCIPEHTEQGDVPGTRTGVGSAPLKAIFRRAVRSRAHAAAAAAAALKGFEIFKKSEWPIIAVSQLIIIFFLFV